MKWLIRILSKSNKNKRGFTLIELMVVVIVVGILAAAAIPIYRFAMSRAYSSEAKATIGTMLTSMKLFAAETVDGAIPAACLDIESDETAHASDAMAILGVDTKTNTWWHAGWEGGDPTTNELTAATATCSFGTETGTALPAAFARITLEGTALGPMIWAYGEEDPIIGIQVVYDVGDDQWYTAF